MVQSVLGPRDEESVLSFPRRLDTVVYRVSKGSGGIN